jgi:hypothetical protein
MGISPETKNSSRELLEFQKKKKIIKKQKISLFRIAYF